MSSDGVLGAQTVEGDADAGPHVDLAVQHHHGLAEGVGDALGHIAGLVGVDDLLHEDGELIPAEPGRRVPSSQAVGQPAGHFDQEGVSGRVAEAVVDQLEVVEVEEEHGQ